MEIVEEAEQPTTTAPPAAPARINSSGWVIFAGTVALIQATANLLYGIVLLVNNDWIVLTSQGIIRFNTNTVGAMFLVFALVLFAIGFGIFTGALWARISGIVAASLGIVAQMGFHSIYPEWSWLVIALNALIIYALTVHGDEVSEL
ncbi:MAG: DUF7144 family membrane protein [Acidimicrobiales bacterium]